MHAELPFASGSLLAGVCPHLVGVLSVAGDCHGAVEVFAGIGCLYGANLTCSDNENV